MANTKVTGDLIASSTIATGNIADNAVTSDKISGITTAHIAEGSNLYYTDARADARVALIVDSAPATLDTLNELAAALGDDPNFATTTATSIGLKAPLASPTFTGTVEISATIPRLNFTDLQQDDWAIINDNGEFKFQCTSGSGVALLLTTSNNATFAGTVQTTQITATNGLNYLKRNTDASLQLRSENTRSGLFITKPATDTVMGSALVLADESYRLGTANYYHMYMLQNGNTYFNQNVGIGETSPITRLEVEPSTGNSSIKTGALEMQSYSVNNAWLADNIYYNGAFRLRSAGYGSQIYFGGGGTITFNRYPTGNAGDAVTSIPSMVLASDGNVGIGTTSPSEKLEVAGNIRMFSAGYPLIDMGITTSNYFRLIHDNPNDSFKIGKNGAGDFTLTGAGNVGIGVTSPEQKLHVEGRGVFDGGGSSDILQIRNDNGGGVFGMTSNLFALDLASTSAFRIRQGSSVPFYLKSDGNVGIGTTSPSQKLDVAGNIRIRGTNQGILLDTTGADQAARVLVENDYELVVSTNRGSAGFGVFGNSNIRLGFGTSHTAAQTSLFINSSGNVGIGTTSPTTKCWVKDSQDSSLFSGLGVERSANTTGVCLNAVGGALNLNTNSSMPLKFRIQNTSMQTINTDGGRAYAGFGGWRMFEYSYTVSVGNGATVDLFQNTSAHSDLHMVQIAIRMFHSGRTYFVGSGTVGGYGMNITGSGSGATNGGLTSAVVSSGIRKLQISQSSGFTAQATIYIQFRLDSGSGINVLNGTLSSL